MKKNKFYYQTFLIIFFSGLTSFSFDLIGQCQQFSADFVGNTCDANGTLANNTDDTFTASVLIEHPMDPTDTWTSSDRTFINEPYANGTIITFGSFSIIGGDVTG